LGDFFATKIWSIAFASSSIAVKNLDRWPAAVENLHDFILIENITFEE
jgi:hypothetical protein